MHHLIVKTVLAQEYFPYNLAYLKNVATALNSQSNGLVGAIDTECRYSHAYKVVNFELLPLGILDGVRPTTLSRALTEGDVLVFLSDGITAAFGSSADIADFLCRQPANNPQSLADKLLAEALARAGRAEDDMTVLAVRLFRRTANNR